MGFGADESESTLRHKAMDGINKVNAIVVVISIYYLAMIRRSFQTFFSSKKTVFLFFFFFVRRNCTTASKASPLGRTQQLDRRRRRIKTDLFASIRAL